MNALNSVVQYRFAIISEKSPSFNNNIYNYIVNSFGVSFAMNFILAFRWLVMTSVCEHVKLTLLVHFEFRKSKQDRADF